MAWGKHTPPVPATVDEWDPLSGEGRKAVKSAEVPGETAPAPSRTAKLALRVLGHVLLWGSIFLSPTVFCLTLMVALWKGEVEVPGLCFNFAVTGLLMLVPLCSLGFAKGPAEDAAGPARGGWCRRGQELPAGCRWVWRPRLLTCSAFVGGILLFPCIFAFFFLWDRIPEVRTDYDPESPVAVIGAGPSGLTASWLLAKGGRKVVLLESDDRIGGHSLTFTEGAGERNMPVDLGFIFNAANKIMYRSYKKLAAHFGHELQPSALNVSMSWRGEYWDNTESFNGDAELEAEIDRFIQHVKAPPSVLNILMPLGIWLWWQGFSERFAKLCLDSTMTVLFVTKMGLRKQSAGAVLHHFGEEGFTHLRYDFPKVAYNPRGSQNMWKKVLADAMSTGRLEVRLRSNVTVVEKKGGAWALTLADGSKLDGFGDVVLACPAYVAKKIVRGGGFATTLAGQIDYVASRVTLHTDKSVFSDFKKMPPEVKYFVTDTHLSGYIDKIFNHGGEGKRILTVSRHDVNIDPSKVKWTTIWWHHYFSMWEIVVARKFLPLVNGRAGLHYAGDWVMGVGHEDAIMSGANAACLVGMKPPEDRRSAALYEEFMANLRDPFPDVE